MSGWVIEEPPTPVGADGQELSARGLKTRRKVLDAAEEVFASAGWYDASISRITDVAGVAQGTFYRYFRSKQAVFDELVVDLNRRVRRAMSAGAAEHTTRAGRERGGFAAFFRFTAEHPGLYRIIRQAEFASPAALHLHYERIARGYVRGLQDAMDAGEIDEGDPEVLAWMLMGIGELIGMRWVLWGDGRPADLADATAIPPAIPDAVFEAMLAFVRRGLGAQPEGPTG